MAFARRFLAARKSHPALILGDLAFLPGGKQVLAFERRTGEGRVLCVFNLSREEAVFSLDGSSATLDLGCGTASLAEGTLRLGPLACWFGC